MVLIQKNNVIRNTETGETKDLNIGNTPVTTPPTAPQTDPTAGAFSPANMPAGLTPEQQASYKGVADAFAPSQTGTAGTQKTTETSVSPEQATINANQEALNQAQAAYQREAQSVHNTILNIQNGSIPLSEGEQAQVDGLKQQFQALVDQQKLSNIGAQGLGNIRGYQTGAAEYDPTFQIKTIGSIVTAGTNKVVDLQIKEASAVAQLTQAFKDGKMASVKDAWSVYQTASKERQDALQKTIDDTQAAIKAVQDRQDKITTQVNSIAVEAAKNGASQKTIAAINASGSVAEALNAAGDSLQTATGDAGAYLFAKRQIESKGGVAPTYDQWYASFQQQQLNSEIAKIQATEGVKFNYAVALEKAKTAIANAPNPNYDGSFAATIKLAAQAGSTNVQRNQIQADLQDFIASGDYKSAYTQILASASAKLTGANASNFQTQTQAYGSLQEMRQVLKEYEAINPGGTNLLKGGVDAIQTKIGALYTDPKYAALAVRLDSAFQQYRQNMTGAAFGAKESADYASVLPSSGNTFSLNMAKIDGASSYLNSVVENTIKNTTGEGGIYIKQYAEAGDQVQQKQADAQSKMTTFRAADPKNNDLVVELSKAGLNFDQIVEELGL